MAQFGRPISDVSIGVWTDDVGGTTNLWAVLDDNTTTEYIEDLNGGNGTYECNITSLTDPLVSTGHIIRFEMQGTGSGGPERCEIQLWQGTTSQIATTGNQTSRGAWGIKAYTLTAGEADTISDYTDLNLRIISSNLGATEDMWVAWAELEIPDAVSYPGGIFKRYNATWLKAKVMVYNGSTWDPAVVKKWSGTVWEAVDGTGV